MRDAEKHSCLGWCSVCGAKVQKMSASKEGTWFGPCGHMRARLEQFIFINWKAPRA